jgi:hypothetical protein
MTALLQKTAVGVVSRGMRALSTTPLLLSTVGSDILAVGVEQPGTDC